MNRVHFSSKTAEHSTPDDFYTKLNQEFPFVLDVCATKDNAKCPRFYTKDEDGLAQDWAGALASGGVAWMNPVYGRTIGKWMAKALAESDKGATVVALPPYRPDTRWWHQSVLHPGDPCAKNRMCKSNGRTEIRAVSGRLKFGGAKNSAPFPSAVVIYRPPVDECPTGGGHVPWEYCHVCDGGRR